MIEEKTLPSRMLDVIVYVSLTLFALITVLPFLHIVAGSFASIEEVISKRFILFPTSFSLDAYRYVFSTDVIFRSLVVSIGITLVGTFTSMFLTSLMAYGLARKDLPGRRGLLFMVVFTMLFSGGMIPTFLVVKEVGLINSYRSLIIPTAISAFNLIILKSFFQNLPPSLEESAKIDGCNDLGILFRIVLPLSMPAIATVSLFYAVTYWNTFMQAILYLNDAQKWPVQVLLRQIVILASGMQADASDFGDDFITPPEQTIKMAVIVVATLPVLIVYPFLQKYFNKGALLGSVKE